MLPSQLLSRCLEPGPSPPPQKKNKLIKNETDLSQVNKIDIKKKCAKLIQFEPNWAKVVQCELKWSNVSKGGQSEQN